MPRGLAGSITTELRSTTFGAPVYAVRITRAPGNVLRWAERDILFVDGTANYSAALLATTPNIYLRLGEAVTSPATTTALDSSGNAQNGTYQGLPTLGIAGALVGDANTAVLLDGASQYINVPDSSYGDLGDAMTLMAWGYMTAYPGTAATIMAKGAGAYCLQVNSSGNLLFKIDGSFTLVTSTVTVPLNQWNQFAFVKNGAARGLFMNGVRVGGSGINSTCVDTASSLHIGTDQPAASYFGGTIDEVSLWPTVLSDAQILALYNEGLGLKEYAARLKSIPNGLEFTPDQATPLTFTVSNVDGAITQYDRDLSFLGAKVEVFAYLPNVGTYYRVWSGWSDEVSQISQEEATFVAYSTIALPNVQVPKRTIGLACTNVFGNTANWNNARDFEGSECPYQRTSTIGFTAQLVGNIVAGDTSITIKWTSAQVTAGAKFQKGETVRIATEKMLITNSPADPDGSFEQVLTVSRGTNDTTPASHSDTDVIYFAMCGYDVANCTRRGMYGNNTSDSYTV
jgi:hypothetical protein